MSVQIGLEELYYALLTTDAADSTPVYETPVNIAGAISANVNPNVDIATLFADDGPYEVATSLGMVELELNTAELTLPVQAVLLGHTYNAVTKVMSRKSTDTPPWLAIGFKSLKSNGNYRYTWLAKGKFAAPEQMNETKNDKVNFQTPTIKGNFVKRVCDDIWESHGDEDDVGFDGSTWFTTPYHV